MTVMAVLNPKGGAGKTTTVTGLGRAMALDGLDVVLVDSDVQGSLREWSEAHEEQPMTVFSIKQSQLVAEIPKLHNDLVIVDGLAKAAKLTQLTLAVADLVIIPVSPAPFDVWACADLVDMIEARQAELEGTGKTLQAVFLITRSVKGATLSNTVAETLAGYNLPVLKTALTFRQEHPKAQAIGRTPLDTRPRCAAASELRQLKAEVLALLGR